MFLCALKFGCEGRVLLRMLPDDSPKDDQSNPTSGRTIHVPPCSLAPPALPQLTPGGMIAAWLTTSPAFGFSTDLPTRPTKEGAPVPRQRWCYNQSPSPRRSFSARF